MSKHYPIHWIESQLILREDRGLIGVCGKRRRAVKVAATANEILAVGIVAGDGRCTESSRCGDVECGLNTTTPETLARGTGVPKGQKVLDVMALNAQPDILRFLEDVFEDVLEESDPSVIVSPAPEAEAEAISTFEAKVDIHLRKAKSK